MVKTCARGFADAVFHGHLAVKEYAGKDMPLSHRFESSSKYDGYVDTSEICHLVVFRGPPAFEFSVTIDDVKNFITTSEICKNNLKKNAISEPKKINL